MSEYIGGKASLELGEKEPFSVLPNQLTAAAQLHMLELPNCRCLDCAKPLIGTLSSARTEGGGKQPAHDDLGVHPGCHHDVGSWVMLRKKA